MNDESPSKDTMIGQLVEAFPHFSKEALQTHNDNQIYTLFHACLDEDGNLKRSEK